MNKRWAIIWAVVAFAAIVLLATTLLNKAWWRSRIMAKWFVDFNPANVDKFGLADLIYYYKNGHHREFPDEQAVLRSQAGAATNNVEYTAYIKSLCTWCTENEMHGIDEDCDKCNHV